MLETLVVIAPLFIIIFGSAFLTRFDLVDKKWGDVLNEFALKLGFPALIFSAISSVRFSLSDNYEILLANSAFLLGSFLLAYLIGKVLKLKKKMFGTLFLCLAFGNVAYLGIPALVEVRGEQILAEASIIVACYLFWMFTIGTGFLEYNKAKKTEGILKKLILKLIKNPLLIAVVLGLVFAGFDIRLPEVINKSIAMLAGSVTPVVLVVIGLFLGKAKFGKIADWIPVFIFSVITLIGLPAAYWAVINYGGLEIGAYWASIIEASMPLAITPFALAKEYKLDEKFIARSIVLSTILSIVTIPFWVSFLVA